MSTSIGCLMNLSINNLVHVSVILCINFILLLLAWTMSIVLCYKLLNHKDDSVIDGKHKKRFHCLLILTALTLSTALIPSILTNLVSIHYYTPLNSINYDNLCKNTNIGTLMTNLQFVAAILGFVGYNLTIFTYYYRLNAIFDNTMFCIARKTRYSVYLSMFGGILCCILSLVGTIINSSKLWYLGGLIFITQYFGVSIYLCLVLKSQLMLLIKQFLQAPNSNKNNSSLSMMITSKLFGVMKRFTILTYFSLIFTIIIIAFIMCSASVNVETKYTFFRDINATIVCIDANVTIICFFNQFIFGDFIYNKTCKKFEKIALCNKVVVTNANNVQATAN